MFNSLKHYGLQPARLLCHGIFRARILEWVAMPSPKGSSWPTDRTRVSCLLQWHADSLPLALPGKLLNGFRAYLSVKPTKKTLAPQSPQGLFFHYNLWCTKTDAKAETPILWPPHVKSWLIRKDADPGKDWRQEEKRVIEDEMVGWHHQWTWTWANSGRWWGTGKPGMLKSVGSRSQTILGDWTTTTLISHRSYEHGFGAQTPRMEFKFCASFREMRKFPKVLEYVAGLEFELRPALC